MKTLLVAVVVGLVGCGSATSDTVERCGGGTGAWYSAATHCNGTDQLENAWCEVHGGTTKTSRATEDGGWECATTWDDPVKGGQVCIHLTCKEN